MFGKIVTSTSNKVDHTVENKHFQGVFKATPLCAPVRPWGHAPRQANPVLTQGRRGAQGRDTPPYRTNALKLIRNPETSEKQQFWTNTFKVALDDYLMTLPDTPPQ